MVVSDGVRLACLSGMRLGWVDLIDGLRYACHWVLF